MRALLILLFSILFIAGCGQKGPLFLPGNTNEVSTTIPRQQADNENEDEEEDEVPIIRN